MGKVVCLSELFLRSFRVPIAKKRKASTTYELEIIVLEIVLDKCLTYWYWFKCFLIFIEVGINVSITVSEMSALGTNELGIYMDRLSLNVVFARSMLECVYRCFQQHNCLSANFWLAPLPYNSICVLNGATRREDYAVVGTKGESYYGADVGEWKFLELLDWCIAKKCIKSLHLILLWWWSCGKLCVETHTHKCDSDIMTYAIISYAHLFYHTDRMKLIH